MGLHTRSGRPLIDPPLRWSLRKAATEHGVAENTIKTGLKRHNIAPGSDQRYSTQEIAKAIFDNEPFEARAREAKAQKLEDEAREVRLRLLTQEGTLLEAKIVEKCLTEIFTQLAQHIRHLPHTTSKQRQEILEFMHGLKIIPSTAGKNGAEPQERCSDEGEPTRKLVSFEA